MNLDEAFARLVGVEGAYSKDPEDSGNWTGGKKGAGTLKGTKYGVSAASYPHLDIVNLTLDQAKVVYRSDYWDKHSVGQMPEPLRYHVFDGVVNSGPGGAQRDGAIRWLQRAAGVPDDGKVGPQTLQALRTADPNRLLLRYFGARLQFLSGPMARQKWDTQGRGLVSRVAAVMLTA